MSTISHEACALEYARYWRTREHAFVSGMMHDDVDTRLHAARNAAGYFRIARNFPTSFDIGHGLRRFEPLVQVFEDARSSAVTKETLVDAVESLQCKLGAPYGGRKLLSAATKFLWLLHREAVVIFDSQAQKALGAPGTNYSRYLELWHKGYEADRDSIASACSMLPASEADRTTASSGWFIRRVYDIYLWRAGAPNRRGK